MEFVAALRPYIELVTLLIEILAIAIILVAIVYGAPRFGIDVMARRDSRAAYHAFKVRLGSALLLGLEILVAADIIRTVALEPTLENVMALGVLVLVRTFLSWSLVVEIEGRWPWQKKAAVEQGESSEQKPSQLSDES